MVDVARPKSVIRNKKIKKVVYAVLVLVAASAVTLGLSRMAPAAYLDSQRLVAASTEYFRFALEFPGCALRRTAPAQ